MFCPPNAYTSATYFQPGYRLYPLPANVSVSDNSEKLIAISSSQNTIAAVAAIVQITFSSLALYSARDMQLDQHGYALFSLTVILFAVMSLINLVGNLAIPEYPCLHIVKSTISKQAIQRGAEIDGTVGSICEDDSSILNSPDFDAVLSHPFALPDRVGNSHELAERIGPYYLEPITKWEKHITIGA